MLHGQSIWTKSQSTNTITEKIVEHGAKQVGKNLMRTVGTVGLTVLATVWPLDGPRPPNGDELYYTSFRRKSLPTFPIRVPSVVPKIPKVRYPYGGYNNDVQYTLRARTDGWYPGNTWGLGQTYSIWLQRGEIWKIGTTVNGQGRYTNEFLRTTGPGLFYVPEFGPAPTEQVLFVERFKLLNYAIQHNGMLPPGNTKLQ